MWPFRKKCKHPQTRILTHKHGVALKCVDCGETIDALPFREVNEFLENGLLQDQICGKHRGRPAGTYWSPFWCVECNIERIDRINNRFSEMLKED